MGRFLSLYLLPLGWGADRRALGRKVQGGRGRVGATD